METDRLLLLGAPKSRQMVTAAMKLKKTLAPWKRSYNQPRQHIKKQRHYFANKGASSQIYGFSSSHYGWESWSMKKAECWRINAFELVLQKTWESLGLQGEPTSPSQRKLERLMLKLKLQYFGHLIQRTDSLEKTDAGKNRRWEEKGVTGWDSWMASLTLWTWVWLNSGSWWWTARPGMLQSMGLQRARCHWTELIPC